VNGWLRSFTPRSFLLAVALGRVRRRLYFLPRVTLGDADHHRDALAEQEGCGGFRNKRGVKDRIRIAECKGTTVQFRDFHSRTRTDLQVVKVPNATGI
jgi:hypothetical protein